MKHAYIDICTCKTTSATATLRLRLSKVLSASRPRNPPKSVRVNSVANTSVENVFTRLRITGTLIYIAKNDRMPDEQNRSR